MSQKPLKKAKKKAGIAPADWERLAANPVKRDAYIQLVQSIQRAQAVAEQRSVRSGLPASDLLDITQAAHILDQHPDLIKYVDAVRRQQYREQSIAQQSVNPQTTKSSPTQSVPQAGSGMWSIAKDAPSGVPNARMWRDFADSNEWTRGAINVRRQQIGRAEIAVVPADSRKRYDKQILRDMTLLLKQPNEMRTNYYEMMASMTEDVLVLDRGVLSKNMTVDRKPVGLYAEDGATIKIYPGWDGDPNKPRYLFEEPNTNRKVPLRNDEAIVIMTNPATYRLGLSIVQILRNAIQADLKATQTAMQMVDQKPPPTMVQLPGASQAMLEDLNNKYLTEIAGHREVFWVGGSGEAKVHPLVWSAKDQQFLEWQLYLARKICALFQISPQQLGITFDINKSTASVQQEIYEDTGFIPFLLTIEQYFNRELLGDFAPALPYGRSDLDALNLRIIYPEVSEAARIMHGKESLDMASKGLGGLPAMTLNQVLEARGEEPVVGGNTFYIKTATGAVPWLSYDGTTGDFAPTSSLGGALGAQDAQGGPSIEDEPDDTGGGSGEEFEDADEIDTEGTDNTTTSVANDRIAEEPSVSNTSSSKSLDLKKAVKSPPKRNKPIWQDSRSPGVNWRPSHMRYAAPEVQSRGKVPTPIAESHSLPAGEIQARLDLSATVNRIFEQARLRGKAQGDI